MSCSGERDTFTATFATELFPYKARHVRGTDETKKKVHKFKKKRYKQRCIFVRGKIMFALEKNYPDI